MIEILAMAGLAIIIAAIVAPLSMIFLEKTKLSEFNRIIIAAAIACFIGMFITTALHFTVADMEKSRRDGYDEGYNKGYTIGFREGEESGSMSGYENALDEIKYLYGIDYTELR